MFVLVIRNRSGRGAETNRSENTAAEWFRGLCDPGNDHGTAAFVERDMPASAKSHFSRSSPTSRRRRLSRHLHRSAMLAADMAMRLRGLLDIGAYLELFREGHKPPLHDLCERVMEYSPADRVPARWRATGAQPA
jgi:hypothetical protein